MHQIVIDGIEMEVIQKPVKHLRLTVYPSEGQVKITAPFSANSETIRLFVTSKLAWIRKHQSQWKHRDRGVISEYMTGENHYYAGQCYTLNLVDSPDGFEQIKLLNESTLELQVSPGSSVAVRERIMRAWYRQQMISHVRPLIPKWEAVIGVKVKEFRIKQMKTRWGSCNIKARRIWLSLELMKRSMCCLEYVLVHEMVHLLERYHNARFYALMDQFMPQWRSYRTLLNQPLLPV